MALEAVIFQQDPFNYGYKDHNFNLEDYGFGLGQEEKPKLPYNLDVTNGEYGSNGYSWEDNSPQQNTSTSAETFNHLGSEVPRMGPVSRKKRRRTKSLKNKEEMENQRMTHIAVERNRRRQMNDYLAVLRTLMPASYAQRGDQASIVGGAINYVKELEQHLQFLEAKNPTNQQEPNTTQSKPFSSFFTFPQYSTYPSTSTSTGDMSEERFSGIADIEVSLVETHANIKVLSKRRPKQLLKMVAGFQSIFLTILHLNVSTVDLLVLYSFSVKVEDGCRLTTVNEIATAVHDMMEMIQAECQENSCI